MERSNAIQGNKIENEIKQINEQNLFLEHDPEADRPMLAYLKGINYLWRLTPDIPLLMFRIFTRQPNQSILENLILL